MMENSSYQTIREAVVTGLAVTITAPTYGESFVCDLYKVVAVETMPWTSDKAIAVLHLEGRQRFEFRGDTEIVKALAYEIRLKRKWLVERRPTDPGQSPDA